MIHHFAFPTFLSLLFFGKNLSAAEPLVVPFAKNGTLKMLYDNRMYPQAVQLKGKVYFVWRGEKGFPYVNSFDPDGRNFGQPHMLLAGKEESINKKRYRNDHHYAPVIWVDARGHLHTLFGCHRTPGLHMVSTKAADHGAWRVGARVAPSISYPKLHHVYGGRTLVYYRDQGHLGFWQYRLSDDHGKTWTAAGKPLVDMDAPPQDGVMASHAGSYHTKAVSGDGKTLHVAFIWKMENELPNKRYDRTLHDHTRRHNLYYLKVDLPTGKAFNHEGRELTRPVTKKMADHHCRIWDTQERVAAVGPSISLDQKGRPAFVLPVSGKTPHACTFYFIRRQKNEWIRSAITNTSHPFNSCHLRHEADGSLRAWLITGKGESVAEDELNQYGWGDAIEEWRSDATGQNWKKIGVLTPNTGRRYQNIQFVVGAKSEVMPGMLFFYGWKPEGKQGTGYLWQAPR